MVVVYGDGSRYLERVNLIDGAIRREALNDKARENTESHKEPWIEIGDDTRGTETDNHQNSE